MKDKWDDGVMVNLGVS